MYYIDDSSKAFLGLFRPPIPPFQAFRLLISDFISYSFNFQNIVYSGLNK